MSIKIYLPNEYFNVKRQSNLFGHVQIGEDNVIVYYIVDVEKHKNQNNDTEMDMIHGHHHGEGGSSDLQYLGAILPSDVSRLSHEMRLCFTYNSDSPNIHLVYVGIMPERLGQIKLILYDKHIVQNLVDHNENSTDLPTRSNNNHDCDFFMLSQLIQPTSSRDRKNLVTNRMSPILKLIANVPALIFKYAVENRFINKLMMHTCVYKHHKEWQETYDKGSRRTNIIIDRILGIILMMILFKYVSHPSDFLIKMSHGIIKQLYALLRVLEGSPIGMKLNIHLNNFFLDCFKYHIELWSTFLNIIEPVVREVFLAIGVFGYLGFTYQIALLADLISIVGLHAHCFYVYTKVLFNVETKCLAVLWQVVRGNRYNILKGRIEVHNYMNRQLYFATIFFSAILFLFPTTFVYYIVFATLKALTFATLFIFDYFRRNILTFPIETRIKWITKGFYEIDFLSLQDVSTQKPPFYTYKDVKHNIFIYKLLG
ncbi:uncharacterized protein PIG-Q [Drosophila tropicalis]|uniref:uncharacterized protein PIG-Q n=1 Tax=Drosophila tropicalis TaxID=46794 RepID=UPI0035ABAF98